MRFESSRICPLSVRESLVNVNVNVNVNVSKAQGLGHSL